jgi:hypothetical protein
MNSNMYEMVKEYQKQIRQSVKNEANCRKVTRTQKLARKTS